MYCPRCAKAFESGTSYCRTCGLSLDGVTAIVKGEAETEPEFKTGPNSDLTRLGIGTFILGTVIALGNAMVRDLGLWPYDLGKYVFMMFIMVGMLLIAAGVVFPKKKYIKTKHRTVTQSDQEMKLETARLNQLPSAERSIDDIDSIIRSREPDSVTEPTTRHLL
jgi:hypothetical protein